MRFRRLFRPLEVQSSDFVAEVEPLKIPRPFKPLAGTAPLLDAPEVPEVPAPEPEEPSPASVQRCT